MVPLINIFLAVLILACLFVTWNINLFECALLLGRSFFSFFIGLGAARPAADAVKASFPLPIVYLEAAACFLAWLAAFIAIEALVRNFVKERTINSMKFDQLLALPARIATGLVSGFLISGVFAITLVTVPAVEGAYVGSGAQVIGGLHRKAAAVYATGYSVFMSEDITTEQVLRERQIRAVKIWAKGQMAGLSGAKRERLVQDIRKHYGDLLLEEDLRELQRYVAQQGGATESRSPSSPERQP